MITTLISVLVTLGVAWYQIDRAQSEIAEAELERERSVRAALIMIVEEHVLNRQPLELTRLSRLIETKRRAESVKRPIPVIGVLESAEFNIINSRYLDFEQKNSVKAVFDSLYYNYGTREFEPLPNEKHVDLVTELAVFIQEGKVPEALNQLNRVSEAYISDVDEETQRRNEKSLFEVIRLMFSENPGAIAAGLAIFPLTFFLLAYTQRFLVRQRRARLEYEMNMERHMQETEFDMMRAHEEMLRRRRDLRRDRDKQ